MKKVFGILAFLSFFFVLGTVGAIECDMIAPGTGFIRAMLGIVVMAVFAKIAGAFECDTREDDDG